MKTLDLVQGTDAWHAHRAVHFNASDAPAMMGVSPYKTRNALLHETRTGLLADVDAGTQSRFDEGHRAEALARPIAEQIIGESLYPVTGSEGKYSASFDGLTMGEDIAFEHKSLRDDIRACKSGLDLPLHYRIQMEQQLMISGASKCLFMGSKWDTAGNLLEEHHVWYEPDLALRQSIVKGWEQFDEDLAAYVPPEVIPAAVGTPQAQLPAVAVTVSGSIAIRDNLSVFGDALVAYVERINKTPETDQDFADLEATVKALKTAEEALDAAESNALAQTGDLDSLRRTVSAYRDIARTNRLMVEKLVKAEKENRRNKIIQGGKEALVAHLNKLNDRLGKRYMPDMGADFVGVVRGLKSIASIQNAVDTELARAKIMASETADRIQINLDTLKPQSETYLHLFADLPQIVIKHPEDFALLVKSRIATEDRRRADERERIRKEEAEKLSSQQAVLVDLPPAPLPTVAVDTGTTIKLGEIGRRLGFQVTEEFLAGLGFNATTDKNARLYRESDFPVICAMLKLHITEVALKDWRKAA